MARFAPAGELLKGRHVAQEIVVGRLTIPEESGSRARSLRTCGEILETRPRGVSSPNSRPDSAPEHGRRLSRRGPPLPRPSARHLPAGPQALPTAARSPPARPVPPAVRTRSAAAQPDPRESPALPTPFVGHPDRQRPPHPARPDSPGELPSSSCYPPRPLSPEDDRLRRQELRRTDDLPASALPLTRATGIRIGECIDPAPDCPRPPGPEQWALHIPIGKLHTERLVPADEGVRRILALRAFALPTHLAKS
jgi:hypothetical protein